MAILLASRESAATGTTYPTSAHEVEDEVLSYSSAIFNGHHAASAAADEPVDPGVPFSAKPTNPFSHLRYWPPLPLPGKESP
jgi:hypothetical protein